MQLSVVIPAAGMARRMKSYGPKSLLKLSGRETIVGRQIRLLRAVRPDAEFVVVAGFESERMVRNLPDDVVVVENRDYADTNVARSLALGLAACRGDNALVVYGDVVFNTKAVLPSIHQANRCRSSVVVAPDGMMDGSEVGVNTADGRATHFSYGLPRKWAHIAYLAEADKHAFVRLASSSARRRLFGFEVLNLMLAEGRTLLAIEPYGSRVAEVDSVKDLDNAQKVALAGD